MSGETKKRFPFHESIVGAIRHAFNANEMECLSLLIKKTKIPRGHDEIIAAWNQRARDLLLPIDNAFGVPVDLQDQKKEAEAEELAKSQAERDAVERQLNRDRSFAAGSL